ncbi:TPA: hypothetical protein VBX77_001754 [Yersinia enterocolitica]|nr:hypothetical protein [Yersinia enterocolitica]
MNIETNFNLEATPERVYSLLKLIEMKLYTQEELKQLVHPISKEGELNKVLKYLTDCKWISKNSHNQYELHFEKEYLETIDLFRRRLNSILFDGDKTIFYMFTEWVVTNDERILGIKVNDYTKENSDLVREGKNNFHLPWRLWASFLGFGNLHNKIFIPNPSNRIMDIIAYYHDEQSLDKPIPLNEFFNWLITKCPELKTCLIDNNISTFLSLALRELHDLEIIKLEYHQDFPNIWYLTSSMFHEIDRQVTHIRLRGDQN